MELLEDHGRVRPKGNHAGAGAAFHAAIPGAEQDILERPFPFQHSLLFLAGNVVED